MNIRVDLGAADEDAGGEDQGASECDLDDGGGEGGVHETVADPGDDAQLDEDDDDGDPCGGVDVWDEVGERVAEAAEGCHRAADEAAGPGVAATGEAAVVGEGFGEAHADACADAGGHADLERLEAVVRGKCGGEERGERGDGAIHEAGEAGLDDLEEEEALLLGGFVLTHLHGADALGLVCVVALLLDEVAEELADACIGGAFCGGFVETDCLEFHELGLFLHGFQAEGTDEPDGAASDEAADVFAADHRDMVAETGAVMLEEAVAMQILLLLEIEEHGGLGGVGFPQAICEIGIDARVVLLEGDGEGEDFFFRQAFKSAHACLSLRLDLNKSTITMQSHSVRG